MIVRKKEQLVVTFFIIVSTILTLVSCSQKYDSYTTVGDYDGVEYPRFLTTDWGMSEVETLKALKIAETDVTKESIVTDDLGTGSSTLNVYSLTTKIGDNDVAAKLTFTVDPVGIDLGLTQVSFDIPSQEALNELATLTKDARYYVKSMHDIATEKNLLDELRPQYEYSRKTIGSSNQEMSKDEWLKSFEAYHKQSYLADIKVSDSNGFGHCTIDGLHAATFKTLFSDK